MIAATDQQILNALNSLLDSADGRGNDVYLAVIVVIFAACTCVGFWFLLRMVINNFRAEMHEERESHSKNVERIVSSIKDLGTTVATKIPLI
jgi:flagellar biosynthesis/type III secretory pathway M-ring protein FliF/YscJ